MIEFLALLAHELTAVAGWSRGGPSGQWSIMASAGWDGRVVLVMGQT